MDKSTLIQKYFQRKHLLTIDNSIYKKHSTDLFKLIMQADEIQQDSTIKLLSIYGSGIGQIVAKQDGIIAGIEEAMFLFNEFTNLEVTSNIADGSQVSINQKILSISGDTKELLAYERVCLNILGRMSGIATNTNNLITKINNPSVQIAATRKTPWMLLDKKAVAIGRGLTHRLSLKDWPMIKDNHLKILQNISGISVEQTIVKAIKQMLHSQIEFFEIEVETAKQAETAVQTFEKWKTKNSRIAVLLDNVIPTAAQETIKQLQNPDIIIEASGNITEENIIHWSKTGIDIISLGSLTHSTSNFDLSMRIV